MKYHYTPNGNPIRPESLGIFRDMPPLPSGFLRRLRPPKHPRSILTDEQWRKLHDLASKRQDDDGRA